MCPNTSFFWSVFSRIWTEYGEILRISPYSVQMRGNTDQKELRIWTLFTQWKTSSLLIVEVCELHGVRNTISRCHKVSINWSNPPVLLGCVLLRITDNQLVTALVVVKNLYISIWQTFTLHYCYLVKLILQ